MDLDFDVDCPNCGVKVKVALQDVAKQRTVKCRRGHSIALKDDGGGARKTQRSLDDLERALKRFGK